MHLHGGLSQMTVGFLYGAGAETLIFATGTSGKKSEDFRVPAEKPKSAVDTQKTSYLSKGETIAVIKEQQARTVKRPHLRLLSHHRWSRHQLHPRRQE